VKVCLLFVGLTACGSQTAAPCVGVPTSQSCRESETPASCEVVECGNGACPGRGGPQGPVLEGPGLERLHFTAANTPPRTPFSLDPGTKLTAQTACGADPLPRITIIACSATGGLASCTVSVDDDRGICGLSRAMTKSWRVVAVRGFWDSSGAWQDAPDVITLSCDAGGHGGALVKCSQFDPVTRRDAFLACVRMQRADYCGDGHPHTVSGTEIFEREASETMTPEQCADGRCFEASWSKDGAVCIARTRWLGAGMGFDACADQFTASAVPGVVCRARPETALLFSRSAVQECGRAGSRPCTSDTDPMCSR